MIDSTCGNPSVQEATWRHGRWLRGLVSLGVVLGLTACVTGRPVPSEAVDVEVEHLLRAIDEAARAAHSRITQDDGLTLQKVAITLETALETERSGDVTLLVVTIDASRARTKTQKITVTLEPLATSKASNDRKPAANRALVEGLERAFDAAMRAARGAKSGLHAVHPDGLPLATKTIAVEIDFDVTSSATGSVTIEILGVDLTGGRSQSRESLHQTVLTFGVDG